MTRQWQPGDVAVVRIDGGDEVQAAMDGNGDWFAIGGDSWLTSGSVGGDEAVEVVRPLVVLDLPDGAKAGWPVVVDALKRASESTGLHITFSGLIAQVEAQTVTPKPPEPTGLGAVVEDVEGVRYVRIGRSLGDMCWRSDDDRPLLHKWSAVTAVRVLSEGIQ